MDAVQMKLRRLRNWFIAWFAVEAVAGTAAAAYVLEGMRYLRWPGHAGAGTTTEVTVAAGLLVSAVLLFLALLVFDALLDLSTWARIALLVIGWLTVGSAMLNVLLLPASSAMVGSMTGLIGGHGSAMTAASLLSNAINLLFWAWAIHTLQFDRQVRDAFCTPRAASGLQP
jgi:hypothetical protein